VIRGVPRASPPPRRDDVHIEVEVDCWRWADAGGPGAHSPPTTRVEVGKGWVDCRLCWAGGCEADREGLD
jgi:hypothetical protein